jgi:D-serine deaminase-like pyridoxal phosphate-dependent protein
MASYHVIPGGRNDLRRNYVGSSIFDLPKPAVIIDRFKMRRHCQSLLDAVDFLGVDFRAHVKTHKVIHDLLHIHAILTLDQ